MNTNNETIFCVWGARASRMLVAVSRRNELPCSILCHRFETRSFPISLVAYPRDFAFYVADPISSIHRSSRINWIRVDSCAFVVTTSLASDASSDSGRADQRDHLAFVPTVNAKILVGCDHTVMRIKLAHPDQTKIRQIGLPVGITFGQVRQLRQVIK